MSITKAYTINNEKNWFYPIVGTPAQEYYHYTGLSSAINILTLNESGKKTYNELWVSHFLYLNDTKEFQEGFETLLTVIKETLSSYPAAVKQYFKNFIDLFTTTEKLPMIERYLHAFAKCDSSYLLFFPNHFSLSFCGDGNLLSQWKWYGKNSGIAIEFELNNCRVSGHNLNLSEGCGAKPLVGNVKYQPDSEKKQTIAELLRFTTDMQDKQYTAQGILLKAFREISYLKHTGFKEEKESRIIFPLVYNDIEMSEAEALKHIKYREVDGIIKPYLKIRFMGNDDKPIIKSVMVGPGQNQQLVFNAMMSLIESNYPKGITDYKETPRPLLDYTYIKINNIEVRRSTIPFRG